MANISILSRLINGVQRNVDLSANTLVVGVLKVGSTDLSQTILTNLITLQNGSDFATGTNSHTHDGRYFTETEVGSATPGTAGSTLVGDNNSYSNFTPSAATVKGALAGIDTQLGTVAGNNSFSDALFNVYNSTVTTKKIFLDASGIAPATLRFLKMADANVDLANLTNSNISASAAIAYSKLNLSNSIVDADINTSASIAYSKLNLATSIKASDQNSQVATSIQPLFANGIGSATYRSIISGDLPDLSSIYVNVSQKGAANGVATLDGGGKVPVTQLPSSVMEFQGAWDPSTNSPTLVDGTGNTGDVYRITVAFAGPIGGLTDPSMVGFQIGDFVIYSGVLAKWQRSPMADGVISVNGQQGIVTVNAINELTGHIAAGPASGSQSKVATIQSGVIVDSMINATAAIAYSKLNLSNSVVNADINASAAIAYSKLNLSNSIVAGDLTSQSVTSAKIATSALDQTTITGGNGTTLAVVASPRGVKSVVAGESMAANTSFLVRYALNGETAGRVYKADQDTTSVDRFYAVGVVLSTGAISAGNIVSATYSGTHILGSSDTPFAGTDIGKAVYLTASGGFSITPPSTTMYAVWRIGLVENTDRIWVNTLQLNGIN
jgi:hypothetical protein